MKKLLTIFLFIGISFMSFGQFTKGTFLVGGNFGAGFTTSKTKNGSTTVTNSKTTGFSFTPDVGYFVIDNLAVGGAIDLGVSSTKASNNGPKQTFSSFTMGPMVRYYVKNFYGQGMFMFGSGHSRYKFGNIDEKTNTNMTYWSLAVGYAYMLNNSVAIEPQVGYSSSVQKESNVKDIDGGVFIKVGFQIYLRKRGE